ncbi:hypothetical protein QJS04_geneDACA014654 [Acorus gramineus]|uniref:Reverse transcriptase zinc-binding domain-containing protein n=1 Tax=Acorus gramineus TaxID=55184 RepID=A0AAV9B761_ACOGR|nr:hypothetical protein QJS04_geneDACA014654 [Acorus gramineus]
MTTPKRQCNIFGGSLRAGPLGGAPRRSRLSTEERSQLASLTASLERWAGSLGEAADRPTWAPNPCQGFSVKRCYIWWGRTTPSVSLMCGSPSHIWNPKIPRKIKVFLCLLVRDRLFTKVYRAKWRREEDTGCGLCGEAPETIAHLFCQCRFAQELWRVMGSLVALALFDSLSGMWEADTKLRRRFGSPENHLVFDHPDLRVGDLAH